MHRHGSHDEAQDTWLLLAELYRHASATREKLRRYRLHVFTTDDYLTRLPPTASQMLKGKPPRHEKEKMK